MTAPQDTTAVVNRALGDVASMMDVVIRVCSWCSRVQSIEPAVEWGSPGLSHTICPRCEERCDA